VAGQSKGEPFDRLSLLKDILPVYKQVLIELGKRGIQWVQIDEPALVLELPQDWLDAFKPAYDALTGQVKLLLTTYFEGVTPNLTPLPRCRFRACTLTWFTAKMMSRNCTSACQRTGCSLPGWSTAVTSGAPI
jgi:hypothetical protein